MRTDRRSACSARTPTSHEADRGGPRARGKSEERSRSLRINFAELNGDVWRKRVEEKRPGSRDRTGNVSQDLLVVRGPQRVFGQPCPTRPGLNPPAGVKPNSETGRRNGWAPAKKKKLRRDNRIGTSKTRANEPRHVREPRSPPDGSYRWLWSWNRRVDRDRNYAGGPRRHRGECRGRAANATRRHCLQSQIEAVGQLTGGIAQTTFSTPLPGSVGSLDRCRPVSLMGRTDNFARYINAAMTSANRAAALTHPLACVCGGCAADPEKRRANSSSVAG